jgi:hypothetical protein
MSALSSRVEKLEEEAAAQVRPASGWGEYWQALRLIYGDHQRYSAEELEAHDGINPAVYADVLEKAHAEREAKKKAQTNESTSTD